jgi:hypothetical protein
VVARVGLPQVSNRGPTGCQGDLKLTGPGARPGGGGGGGGGAEAPEVLLTLSAYRQRTGSMLNGRVYLRGPGPARRQEWDQAQGPEEAEEVVEACDKCQHADRGANRGLSGLIGGAC